MQALCRVCLTWLGRDPGQHCPSCAQPRLVRHVELGTLAIAHMDCDAFYATVEKREDPSLANKPLIVGGGRRGVVTTCCYLARVSGVRSAMPMFKALKLCPEAVVLTPRMDLYAEVGRQVRSLMLEFTPLVEPLSLDEAFLDLSGTERLFGAPPALSLARLAARIEREIGITISVGLSHTKSLAKMASDINKPRGFEVIGRAETQAFLDPRPVGAIWGVGPALGQRLERDGLRSITDLRQLARAEIVRRYGRVGERLHDLAHGIDLRPVLSDRPSRSISSETTFEADLTDFERLSGHLWRLGVRTSDRAKAAGLAGRVVTLKLKTAGFRSLSRQVRLVQPTQMATALYTAAEPLLLQTVEAGPFRLIGVGLSDLAPADSASDPRLFGEPVGARERAEHATDQIRARFGPGAIVSGRALR